jgi:hypothetical protein
MYKCSKTLDQAQKFCAVKEEFGVSRGQESPKIRFDHLSEADDSDYYCQHCIHDSKITTY